MSFKTIKEHWFRKHSQHAAKKGPGIAKFLKFLENLQISQNSWNFMKFTENPQILHFFAFSGDFLVPDRPHPAPGLSGLTLLLSQILGDGYISKSDPR